MDICLKHGVIVVSESGEPDWGEVVSRLRILQGLCGDIDFRFMRASYDWDYGWEIPFVSVERLSFVCSEEAIEQLTPYRVLRVEPVQAASVPGDRLSALLNLVERGAPSVCMSDLVGRRPRQLRLGSGEEIFDGLVGMDEQKLMLMKLSRMVAKHGRGVVECLHLIFEGNPGTGKTELATRLIRHLDHIGVTDGTQRLVRVGGNDLMAECVGQTAPKVKRVVDSACGGMLLIDEFYALGSSAGTYGVEAIDALTEQLDLRRGEVICVISGYPAEVERTLALNRGLRERFGYRLSFPDYTNEQLAQIFRDMSRGRGFMVDPSCRLDCAFDRLRRAPSFSNARSARRLVDHAVIEASWDHDELVIFEGDLERALVQSLASQGLGRVGF